MSFLLSILLGLSSLAQAQEVVDNALTVRPHKSVNSTKLMAVQKGLTNIPKGALKFLEKISAAAGGKSYKKLISNTLYYEARKEYDEKEACLKPKAELPISDLLAASKTTECECNAWKSCPGKKCSPEVLCPFDLRIFSATLKNFYPYEMNYLAVRNHEEGAFNFKEISGFCWGMAAADQKLSALAIYHPDETPPFEKGSEQWVAYYKKIIDGLFKNNATIVVGFKNLNEFSADPHFKNYFAEKTSKEWANNSMSIRGLINASKSTSINDDDLAELYLLSQYGASAVLIKPGIKLADSHAVVSTHLVDTETILIKDNNYKNAKKLARKDFVLSYHAREDLAHQARSLQKLCLDLAKKNQLAHFFDDPHYVALEDFYRTVVVKNDANKAADMYKGFSEDEKIAALALTSFLGPKKKLWVKLLADDSGVKRDIEALMRGKVLDQENKYIRDHNATLEYYKKWLKNNEFKETNDPALNQKLVKESKEKVLALEKEINDKKIEIDNIIISLFN